MKWAVAFIDNKKRETIYKDFKSLKIEHEIGIPVIKVLKKRFKNKQYFETVPLLFNYGFIRLPRHTIKSRETLIDIKDKIPAIYNWMYKSPCKAGFIVETVPEKVVKELDKKSKELSIFSAGEFNRIKTGDFIVLRGYPFEGLKARIKSVNHKSKRVLVDLEIMDSIRQVEVSYENVFYSIYTNFDESLNSNSLDEIESRYKNSLDRFQYKRTKDGRNR